MAINDIRNFISLPAKYRLFADDLNIFLMTDDPKFSQLFRQQTLNNWNTWSNSISFQFTPIKSKCIIFTKKKSTIPPVLQLSGINLLIETQHIFLYIKFDHRLTCIPYLENLQANIQRRLNILKMLQNRAFGPGPRKMMQITERLSDLQSTMVHCHTLLLQPLPCKS